MTLRQGGTGSAGEPRAPRSRADGAGGVAAWKRRVEQREPGLPVSRKPAQSHLLTNGSELQITRQKPLSA